MIVKIKTNDLKVGMHVIIPESWSNHPFARNSFNITSRDQIQKISKHGFDEVSTDTDKGFPIANFEEIGHSDNKIAPLKVWEPERLVPSDLREAIHDMTLPPERKAKVVYRSSVELMGRLLDDPKTENIAEAKHAITDIVDMVLLQEDTSLYLLRITSHDFYTYVHSVNVGFLGILLSIRLLKNSQSHNMHELGAGFFLHDLGKVRVDPAIINKQGRLTEDEMKKVRIHPYQSYLMLKEANQLSDECGIIALQHHEREDGKGYPKRLMGDEIHTYGRICCIADVFDALTAERSYKARLTAFEALRIMKEEMLNHFHREIFEQFVLMFMESGIKKTAQ
ncbi:MAG TPA: HD domain-containing phosphohydrolase [Dissulfurispiraceae bacterium]|nr:HD domain-containing phosphohydrolase [Dissulfurispiraceae bacterium]